MTPDPVASRYAQALFESAKQEQAVDQIPEQLLAIGTLLRDHPDLRQFLWNPDVEPEDKLRVLDRLLKSGWSPLLQAFVRMVIAMGRAESLPAIVEAFQALADEAAGRMRAIVRAARPLPEAALKRLRTVLERREGKSIELRTELAPELLGGIQVQLDHRVIDGSVRRQLIELGQQLAAVRVHGAP